MNANRVVARERLIDELWGERPPDSAVKSVQVYVSRLRKLLPSRALETRARGYVLDVARDQVDLLRFERLVAEARRAEPADASRLLRDALALWRGPPLAEFDEPFAKAEAGRLEDLRLAALEERLEADLALGLHAELVGELESLVAEQPHRERLRALLLLALYRCDRQAEALAAYRDARTALGELGLEPSARLRALEKQILTQDPGLDPATEPLRLSTEPIPLPGSLLTTSPFPFVGRGRNWRRFAVCSSAPSAAREASCCSAASRAPERPGWCASSRARRPRAGDRLLRRVGSVRDRPLPAAARMARVPLARLRSGRARGLCRRARRRFGSPPPRFRERLRETRRRSARRRRRTAICSSRRSPTFSAASASCVRCCSSPTTSTGPTARRCCSSRGWHGQLLKEGW